MKKNKYGNSVTQIVEMFDLLGTYTDLQLLLET